MSNSGYEGYDKWAWASIDDAYDPTAILYSGDDMNDAYNYGKHWYTENENLLAKVDALENLLSARVRLDKQYMSAEEFSKLNNEVNSHLN